MVNQKLFDEFTSKLNELLARTPAKDIEKNVRALMTSFFTRLDLITREEFDVQMEVLKRTREKLEALEAKVAQLEARSQTPLGEP